MKALYFENFGEADVLKYGELPDPIPQKGEALVRTKAIGLNFADIAKSFLLSDGAEAHHFLESRQSIGKVLLLP